MSWPRLIAVLLSIGVHAGVVYALLPRLDSFALQAGNGVDDLTVVATVSVSNGEIFGTSEEDQEAHEATPALEANNQPKPPEETKPETVAKAEPPKPEEAEPTPQEEIKPEEPKPEETKQEEPKPEEKPVEKEAEIAPPPKPLPQTQAQAATQEIQEQRAAKALEGRRSKLASAYQGQIFTALVRHKVHPHVNLKGRVVLALTIAPSGELMSREVVQSSGSEVLDRAAIASLDKAAPFPPLPSDLGTEPYKIRVPFEYSTR